MTGSPDGILVCTPRGTSWSRPPRWSPACCWRGSPSASSSTSTGAGCPTGTCRASPTEPPDLPDIPWPDLDLPDWSLPGWLAAVLASKKYWFPILVAIGVAVAEVRRRRRRDAEWGEGECSVARTVDPAKHAARRLQIIDAGLTCFAAHGYDGATTALICREAGIGSGTFFHYFPTKADLLVATLELGTGETEEWFAARRGRPDAVEVLREYVAHAAAESADPRVPGFVRAVGAVMSEPRIAAALAADERTLRVGLLPWVRKAQAAGQVRTDLSAPAADRLADGAARRLPRSAGRRRRVHREAGDPHAARRGREADGAGLMLVGRMSAAPARRAEIDSGR